MPAGSRVTGISVRPGLVLTPGESDQTLLPSTPVPIDMAFEEDDAVILHDEHSEYDGEEGTVTQIVETMFGDANYTVSFEDGQEQGIPEDSLEPVDEE